MPLPPKPPLGFLAKPSIPLRLLQMRRRAAALGAHECACNPHGLRVESTGAMIADGHLLCDLDG